MRQGGVVLAEFVPKEKEGLLWFALARDKPERPVGDLLPAGEPFVSPGKENSAGQTAFHHAVDMPAEHCGLLILGVANRVHPEFAEDERTILGEILQAQEVTLECVLVVQVNIEAGEVAVLREEKLSRRITGVGIEDVRIGFAPDSDQVLDEFGHTPNPEPAN